MIFAQRILAATKADQVMAELHKLGWSKPKRSTGGGMSSERTFTSESRTGGQLNPNGKLILVASYDSVGRYLEVYSGFKMLFDVDTRDGNARSLAEDVNKKAQSFV